MQDGTRPVSRRDAVQTMAWGVVWLVGAACFVFYSFRDPLSDLRLMIYAKTAQGEIFDTFEDVQDGEDGRDHWDNAIAYRFRLPDGRTLQNVSRGSGRLRADLVDLKAPVPADVEYHPDNPTLNRLKGEDSGAVGGWLIRTTAFMFVLGMLCWPGIHLVRNGVAQWKALGIPAQAAEVDTAP